MSPGEAIDYLLDRAPRDVHSEILYRYGVVSLTLRATVVPLTHPRPREIALGYDHNRVVHLPPKAVELQVVKSFRPESVNAAWLDAFLQHTKEDLRKAVEREKRSEDETQEVPLEGPLPCEPSLSERGEQRPIGLAACKVCGGTSYHYIGCRW
jgi:hypothetical protein